MNDYYYHYMFLILYYCTRKKINILIKSIFVYQDYKYEET